MNSIAKILIFSFLLLNLFASAPLGKVAFLKGFATMTDIKTKQKMSLKVGDEILEGTLLKTEKNSRMIIELSGGVKKLLPANTELFFFTKETLEIYKKTDESIQKTFSLTGKKASNSALKITLSEAELKELRSDLNSGKYIEALDKLENRKLTLKEPEALYMKAVCYLKLGVEKESEKLFQQLIDSKIYEYKKISYFGLFIGYIRSGQTDKAKNIYEQFQDEARMAEEMQKYFE